LAATVILKDRVHITLGRRQPGDVAPAEHDPARVGALKAGDQPQARRLPRPRRAEQREELTALDLEVDLIDRLDVAVVLDDAREVHVDALATGARALCVLVLVRGQRRVHRIPPASRGRSYSRSRSPTTVH